MLSADPAFVLLVSCDLPLAGARAHFLIADMPLDYAFLHVEGARVIDLIHALRVDYRLELETGP